MKHKIPGVLVPVLFVIVRIAALTYDPSYALTAYKLSAAQETQFDGRNNKRSTFWGLWEKSSFDRVVLTGENSKEFTVPPQNPHDGGIEVMAAYGVNGLYLLFTIHDDEWAEPIPGWVENHEIDGLEFFLDKHGAEDLYGNPAYFADTLNTHLTTSFRMVRIRIGETPPSTELDFISYEPNSGNCSGTFLNGMCFPVEQRTFLISLQYGVECDMILPQNDSLTRFLEWLIPWWAVGPSGNGLPEPKKEGEHMAFCFGYHDYDDKPDHKVISPESPDEYTPVPTTFSWRNNGLPSNSTKDTWGDIEFSRPLEEVHSNNVISSYHLELKSSSTLQHIEYYDITGRRLGLMNESDNRKSGIIIFYSRHAYPGLRTELHLNDSFHGSDQP